MEAAMRVLCVLGFLAFVAISMSEMANAAGECGKSTTPGNEAMKLIPCASDANAAVAASCCAQVKQMGKSPACLRAVLLSDTAKASGVDPKVALTIPKRCNFANRPIGYKCGPYTLP